MALTKIQEKMTWKQVSDLMNLSPQWRARYENWIDTFVHCENGEFLSQNNCPLLMTVRHPNPTTAAIWEIWWQDVIKG